MASPGPTPLGECVICRPAPKREFGVETDTNRALIYIRTGTNKKRCKIGDTHTQKQYKHNRLPSFYIYRAAKWAMPKMQEPVYFQYISPAAAATTTTIKPTFCVAPYTSMRPFKDLKYLNTNYPSPFSPPLSR